MSTKSFWTYIFCLYCIFPCHAEAEIGITKDQARSIVSKFYRALQGLPKVTDNEFYEYRNRNIYPYIIDNQSFKHPDDIHILITQSNEAGNSKLINAYMRNIRDYSKEKGLQIAFNICDISDLREVVYENQKERLALTYWEITVDKTFTISGEKYQLKDTVDVKICNGKIALISNRLYREITLKPKSGETKDIEAWHSELITRAARYWTQGRKKEAYDTYVKSVEDYDDPDTYFRIGVLLLKHHKECTDLKKNSARNLAYSYFMKAKKLGHSEARRVIEWHWGYSGPAI